MLFSMQWTVNSTRTKRPEMDDPSRQCTIIGPCWSQGSALKMADPLEELDEADIAEASD